MVVFHKMIAKYLSKDEGLKINTQETGLPLNHGYHQLPAQDKLIRQTHIEGFGLLWYIICCILGTYAFGNRGLAFVCIICCGMRV
jgi:hypothetical protein